MPAGYIVQAQGRHGAVLRQARGNHELEVRGPSARLGLLLPHTTTTTSQNPQGTPLTVDARFDELAFLQGKRIEVRYWDAGTRRNRWCAGLAKIATRRRGLQVLFDDRFDKIGHFTESEVNEGMKGTFWRFE